ncbi:hypothetical protein V0R50_02025 [Pseudomonas sp. 148P]|uniref:DUF1349 domain-containing protein n=1 Tax=Pseudomonas ulcerans TaxID=3115852 RepID=A0ABU7HKE1_9PSED|nr:MULTISPECIES: hypothetical protein [unclassified Pseudomonas]MEE1922340.1 hypothetical protein [Pseudomonas sp. 147P]MEE1931985.1 hypothetical protein [Pseudomonas sp. 148P]
MTEIYKELIKNGDFATGNLDGWTIITESDFSVMEYEPGKNCAVLQSFTVSHDGLRQVVYGKPGIYEVSFLHRTTDKAGQPVDIGTLNGAGIIWTTSEGMESKTLLLVSGMEWRNAFLRFEVPKVESLVRFHFGISNIDNSFRAALRDDSRFENIESPIAVANVSFRMIL